MTTQNATNKYPSLGLLICGIFASKNKDYAENTIIVTQGGIT